MNVENNLALENLPNDVVEGIYTLVSWGHTIIVTIGRVLVADGDYTFANSYETEDQHDIRAKDITAWLIDHKHFLVNAQQQEQFNAHLEAIPPRIYKLHKDIKYICLVRN